MYQLMCVFYHVNLKFVASRAIVCAEKNLKPYCFFVAKKSRKMVSVTKKWKKKLNFQIVTSARDREPVYGGEVTFGGTNAENYIEPLSYHQTTSNS